MLKYLENLMQKDGEFCIPSDIRYDFSGDSENMKDMLNSMVFAIVISILFIYFILTVLYESFVVPAVFSYIDRFRIWVKGILRIIFD